MQYRAGIFIAAAEGDGQMRVVAADAGPFVESLRGAAGGAGVLVVEGNMVMNVSRRLPARAAYPGAVLPKSCQAVSRQQIGLTIAAAQQEHEGIFGQILHGVLPGGGHNLIRPAAISDYAVGRQAEAARRRQDAVAPVSEGVAIAGDGNGWLGGKAIGNDDVGRRVNRGYSRWRMIGVGCGKL